MANPNLLERESFTDMLLAVFHLTDELIHREDVNLLPDSDLAHLREGYPDLFSLALRTNPFDPSASAEVR